MTRRVLHGLALLLLTAGMLAASPVTPVRAQGQMDPPTFEVLDSGSSYVTIRVTAGPSGAPLGFYVEWMYQSAYDALGGWPADPYDPSLYYCIFDGQPTWHFGGTNGYALGTGESVDIVLGELFDETGVTTDYLIEMAADQGVVVRGLTVGTPVTAESNRTATMFCHTPPPPPPCVLTQGYWKTHGSKWPVSSLMLGTANYTKVQLLSILNTPANGNGLLILAHQLIATKLDLAKGASNALIQSTVDAADALIGGLVVPPVGSGSLAPSAAHALAYALDQWNNEKAGPVPCDGTTPTDRSTWGSIKIRYR